MYHTFFIHSSVDGHLGYFHVLAIVNSAAMNNGIYVSLSVLVSSGYMLRSGIARSYFPGGSERKASAYNVRDQGSVLGREDFLEKEMVTHSNILAWKIPWTKKPGRLQAMHGIPKSLTRLSDFIFTFTFTFMVVLLLGFQGISIPSSTVAESIYIPTKSARGFPFLHTLSSIYCL